MSFEAAVSFSGTPSAAAPALSASISNVNGVVSMRVYAPQKPQRCSALRYISKIAVKPSYSTKENALRATRPEMASLPNYFRGECRKLCENTESTILY
jgi:hypothetical protein